VVDRDKVVAALKLVQPGLSPTEAERQVSLGRTTVYRGMALAGINRTAAVQALRKQAAFTR
jgi:hypothetical protein